MAELKTRKAMREAIERYNAKKWRVNVPFDLEDHVQERIEKTGLSASEFIRMATMAKLDEFEKDHPFVYEEKPIEEPNPVEKHDDDISDLSFKATYATEETPKKETAADQPKHSAKTQEEILEELDIYEKARRRGVVFTPDMTMEDLLKGMAEDMPPSAAEANKNKDDLTFVGGSL